MLFVGMGGCDWGTRDTEWLITTSPPSLARRALAVQAVVRRNTCDDPGEVVWRSPTQLEPLGMPPALGAGSYCLSARLLEADTCAWFADGRRTVVLPRDRGDVVTVELTERAPPVPCEGAECDLCQDDDGGVDAGHDGSADAGPPDAGPPDAGSACDDTAPPSCDGNVRVTCVDGRELRETCPTTCGGSEGLCEAFDPSNVNDGTDWWGADEGFLLDTAALGADADTAVFLDAVTGELCLVDDGADTCRDTALRPPHFTRSTQHASPGDELSGSEPVGVFVFREIHVAAGTRLYVVQDRSEPSTPAVLLVAGDVRVDGLLRVGGCRAEPCFNDVRGAGTHGGGAPGSSGSGPGAGEAGTGLGDPDGSGGAGGSYGSSGGAGGDGGSGGPLAGGRPGPVYGNLEISPLVGGSGGGAGVPGLGAGGDGAGGGWGGGALQISARGHIVVSSSGVIDASGDGGFEGRDQNTDSARGSGGGGGSGGALLLEAPYVLVEGSLTANGGGGGAAFCDAAAGLELRGSWGGWDELPAPGGTPVAGCDDRGEGGAGSDAEGGAAEDGQSAVKAGGGGGGAGRIRINTGPDGWQLGESALVSPSAAPAPCPTSPGTSYLATCGTL
jgi:hypothetical protein